MTEQEEKRYTLYREFIDGKIAEIQRLENKVLKLHEELKAWHQSEDGRDFARLDRELCSKVSAH